MQLDVYYALDTLKYVPKAATVLTEQRGEYCTF